MSDKKPVLFLCLPMYDERMWSGTHMTIMHALMKCRRVTIVHSCSSGSLLPYTFNAGWGPAVANELDYFCMIHADIAAQENWLDVMLDELESHQADLISAVVPIKDDSQTTSTSWDKGHDFQRLTYEDVRVKLPKTFSEDDVRAIYPECRGLGVNTGLWVAKIKGDWARKFEGFRIGSGVRYPEPKSCHHWIIPEDWEMSRQLNAMVPKPKLVATTAVEIQHFGNTKYRIPAYAPRGEDVAVWSSDTTEEAALEPAGHNA